MTKEIFITDLIRKKILDSSAFRQLGILWQGRCFDPTVSENRKILYEYHADTVLDDVQYQTIEVVIPNLQNIQADSEEKYVSLALSWLQGLCINVRKSLSAVLSLSWSELKNSDLLRLQDTLSYCTTPEYLHCNFMHHITVTMLGFANNIIDKSYVPAESLAEILSVCTGREYGYIEEVQPYLTRTTLKRSLAAANGRQVNYNRACDVDTYCRVFYPVEHKQAAENLFNIFMQKTDHIEITTSASSEYAHWSDPSHTADPAESL